MSKYERLLVHKENIMRKLSVSEVVTGVGIFGPRTNEGTKLKLKVIGYWLLTAFLLFNVLAGGISELAQRKDLVEGMVALGYPVYFIMILGGWKVLATIALLVPGFTRLKEWAYAGIFFNMTGATISHAVSGSVGTVRIRCRGLEIAIVKTLVGGEKTDGFIQRF